MEPNRAHKALLSSGTTACIRSLSAFCSSVMSSCSCSASASSSMRSPSPSAARLSSSARSRFPVVGAVGSLFLCFETRCLTLWVSGSFFVSLACPPLDDAEVDPELTTAVDVITAALCTSGVSILWPNSLTKASFCA